jgi:hypothetical protein
MISTWVWGRDDEGDAMKDRNPKRCQRCGELETMENSCPDEYCRDCAEECGADDFGRPD